MGIAKVTAIQDVDGARLDEKNVFSSFVPSGTVLWQGERAFLPAYTALSTGSVSSNTNILLNSAVDLGDTSRLKNGIQINVNPTQLLSWSENGNKWARTSYSSAGGSLSVQPIQLTKKQMQSGGYIVIGSGSFGHTSAKMVDDTHLMFYSQRSSAPVLNNSTYFTGTTNGGAGSSIAYMFLIQSVTAF